MPNYSNEALGIVKNPSPKKPSFRSIDDLNDHISTEKLGHVDSREWVDQWAERWVVFADLIAFASRANRSDKVVVNNIVRFDRASQIVALEFPQVEVRRFSDSTFAIAADFHTALAFGVGLAHSCHAFNREYLERSGRPFFIHLIVPRITMACGRVLVLPSTVPQEARYTGIDPRNILAGSAIVKAYGLEKASAGGLLTLDAEGKKQLTKLEIRGDEGGVTNGLKSWLRALDDPASTESGEIFCYRNRVIDVPWLLLRPFQTEPGALWAATREESDSAISWYLRVWESSIREFYAPQSAGYPLDVARHPQAAMRHAVQCYQLSHGERKPRYQPYTELL